MTAHVSGVVCAPHSPIRSPARTVRGSLLAERVDPADIARRLNAGEVPSIVWTAWERIEMPRDTFCILAFSLCVLLALIGFRIVIAPSPRIRYVAGAPRDTTTRGREVWALARTFGHMPRGIVHGMLLGGNSVDDLSAARRAAQRFIRLRFMYDPSVVNSAFRQLAANATPAGARQLRAAAGRGSETRTAIEQVILGDSGVLSLHEYGTGAYSYGVAPGVIRVVIPLIGRLHSRHFPYDGALSGLPVYETALVTVRKDGASHWLFDSLAAGTIDSILTTTWQAYHFATRSHPAVVIDGAVVPTDSIWAKALARGAAYRSQH